MAQNYETEAERLARLHKTETVGLYIVKWSEGKNKWELRRRLANTDRTLFLASDTYKTTLIMTANRLQD